MQTADQVRVLLEYNDMLKREHCDLEKIAKMNKEVENASEKALDEVEKQNYQLRDFIE